jgi:hypothetical protein
MHHPFTISSEYPVGSRTPPFSPADTYPGTGICGDPHFAAPGNIFFDWHGKRDETFSIISDSRFQVGRPVSDEQLCWKFWTFVSWTQDGITCNGSQQGKQAYFEVKDIREFVKMGPGVSRNVTAGKGGLLRASFWPDSPETGTRTLPNMVLLLATPCLLFATKFWR